MTAAELLDILEGQDVERVKFRETVTGTLSLDWIHLSDGRVFKYEYSYDDFYDIYVETDIETIGGPPEDKEINS